MHIHVYLLAQAENSEEAEAFAEHLIDENTGDCDAFDYGGIDENKEIVPLKEVWDYLVKERETVDASLKERAKNLAVNCQMLAAGVLAWKREAGLNAGKVMELCFEDFCPEMPFFNGVTCDWSLPDEETRDKFFAVPIDMHSVL